MIGRFWRKDQQQFSFLFSVLFTACCTM